MATVTHASIMPRLPSAADREDGSDSGDATGSGSPVAGSRADRLRQVFGLRGGARLPQVNPATLRTYHEYLRPRLTIPFAADHCPPSDRRVRTVLVVGLRSLKKPGADLSRGLYCVARDRDMAVELPLVDLEVPDDDPNFQLLEDYWYWVWNWGIQWPASADSGTVTGLWS